MKNLISFLIKILVINFFIGFSGAHADDVYNQEENRIYDYDDCKELHKDLPIPACLSLLEEYSLVINLKKK